MPITLMPKRAKEPSGPRPSDETINAFVDFFEANDLQSAQEAFLQTCKLLEFEEPHGNISDFYVKFKIALKEHVPYKYRDIWNILDKKANQKPFQGKIFWSLFRFL